MQLLEIGLDPMEGARAEAASRFHGGGRKGERKGVVGMGGDLLGNILSGD